MAYSLLHSLDHSDAIVELDVLRISKAPFFVSPLGAELLCAGIEVNTQVSRGTSPATLTGRFSLNLLTGTAMC